TRSGRSRVRRRWRPRFEEVPGRILGDDTPAARRDPRARGRGGPGKWRNYERTTQRRRAGPLYTQEELQPPGEGRTATARGRLLLQRTNVRASRIPRAHESSRRSP